MFDPRHQKMKALKNILILNSAGNSNSNVPENEEAQNYHHFLSV
jgi:hypothetical protein